MLATNVGIKYFYVLAVHCTTFHFYISSPVDLWLIRGFQESIYVQPFLNPVQLYLNDKSSVSSKTGFLGPYKVKQYIFFFSFYKQILLVWLGVRIIKHFFIGLCGRQYWFFLAIQTQYRYIKLRTWTLCRTVQPYNVFSKHTIRYLWGWKYEGFVCEQNLKYRWSEFCCRFNPFRAVMGYKKWQSD